MEIKIQKITSLSINYLLLARFPQCKSHITKSFMFIFLSPHQPRYLKLNLRTGMSIVVGWQCCLDGISRTYVDILAASNVYLLLTVNQSIAKF